MNTLKSILAYAYARLLEPSSWLAVTAFAGAVAVQLQSHNGLIVALGAGAMAIVLPENKI